MLYRGCNFDEHHIYQPTIYDLTNTVESQNSNIDTGYSTKIIFVDHNDHTDSNGGYDTIQQFTTGSFENLLRDRNNNLI